MTTFNNPSRIDPALAAFVAAWVRSQPAKAPAPAPTPAPKPTATITRGAVKPVSAPACVPPAVTEETAKAFILALSRAGMTANDKGVYIRTAEPRADEANAIRAFTGSYSVGEPHGSQLDAARARAQRALRPVTAPAAKPSVTVRGWTAAHNPEAIELRDARARILLALDDEKAARRAIEDARTETERLEAQGALYVALERGRLARERARAR